jgi:hypothetical protein
LGSVDINNRRIEASAMSTPIDNEKYPPSGDGAKLPGLASPSNDVNQLRNIVDNLKEIVEIREGRRGSKYDQSVTWRDLYNVGLIAVQSGGNTFINRTGSGGVAGVTLLSPNLQAMMAEEFDRKVKASGAYKDLSAEIGVAAAYKGAPQEVIDILTTNLSDESIKRGADIRKVETKIQQVDKSLALSVRELTAGIDSAQASVREVMYSSVNRDEATAGAVTTVNARLNNFGGGGVTVEQKMTATVNRVTGLEGIYSVKVVVDNNGTPYITGFALSSTVTAGGAATSSFVVNASNFSIYRPGTSSVAPFGVDTINNEVFINGTLRINSGGTSINSVSATATSADATATAANALATTANGTANTANGTANTANGTANSALSLATTANGTANSATSALTTKLNKAGADVLTGPISLQASNTILVGTTNDGVAMGSSGIIGRKAGVTTFSVAADGTAIFSGSVTAGSIIAGGVTIGVGGTALSTVESTASTANTNANAAASAAASASSAASAASASAATKLSKAGADILTGPISLQASDTILVGTLSNGVAIGSTGIIGRKSSATTFSIAADGTAIFAGSVTAGAIIADSVTLNSAGGTSLSIIASQASGALPSASFSSTLQTNLNAGVTNILAGTGSNYRLTVDANNAFVAFSHKDAVYNGTAYTGSGIRPAIGISAAGIAMGYNDAGGTWQNAVALSSTGDLTVKGTITAGSIITGSVTIGSGGTTLTTVEGNASNALTTAGTANTNATAAAAAAAAAAADAATKLSKNATDILSGGITFSSAGGFKTGSISIDGSGNATGAGVAFTSKGIVGRTAGATTFTIDSTTGAATFKGDISGASGTFTGSITGASGTFTGSITGATGTFTGSVQSASSGNRVILNESSSAYIKVYDNSGGTIFSVAGVSGLYANSSMAGASAIAALNVTNASGYTGTAISGTNNGSGHGVLGNTNDTGTTRNGVLGISAGTGTNAAAVYGSNLGSYGMYCAGRFGISDSNVVSNLNANYLQSKQASDFATVASGTDAYAANRLNGSAGSNVLRFVQGTVTGASTATFAGTNKPGSSSTNVWVQFTIDGTTLYIPAWT